MFFASFLLCEKKLPKVSSKSYRHECFNLTSLMISFFIDFYKKVIIFFLRHILDFYFMMSFRQYFELKNIIYILKQFMIKYISEK